MSNCELPKPANASQVGLSFGRSSLMAVVCLTLLGCFGNTDSGPPRARVAGMITYQGKPVPRGNIAFIPMPGVLLPVSGAEIIDGRYEVTNNGGVPIGKHRVEINGWSSEQVSLGVADVGATPQGALVPEQYNAKSDLVADVSQRGAMSLDFDLK